MALDDSGEPLPTARLAVIEGTGVLRGPGGLDERRKKLRTLRQHIGMYLALAVGVLFLPLLPGSNADFAFVLVVWAAAAVGLGYTLWVGASATPFLERETIYSDRIPGRAIWDASDLGAFGRDDVDFVKVTRDRVGDVDWLEVKVLSTGGESATFRGFTRASREAQALRRSAVLGPEARAALAGFGGGAEEILRWARESGLEVRE